MSVWWVIGISFAAGFLAGFALLGVLMALQDAHEEGRQRLAGRLADIQHSPQRASLPGSQRRRRASSKQRGD